MGNRDKPVANRLAYYLLKSVNKAVREYAMVADGDRVAVGVSGGKDSLALLHLLDSRRQYVQENYDIIAVHAVRSGGAGTEQPGLRNHLATRGQQYVEVQMDEERLESCFRCSYLRRKALLRAAGRLGCNKLALGHHTDDAAATTLLNLFFHGRAETLSPTRSYFEGKMLLIRPMIYVREKEIARFVKAAAFPVGPSSCAGCAMSQRGRMRQLLRSLEGDYPKIRINLLRAGLRWMRACEGAGDQRTSGERGLV